MEFERVLNGLIRCIDNNVYNEMTDWQELAVKFAIIRNRSNVERLKTNLMNSTLNKIYMVFNDDGTVDIDGLVANMKELINLKGKVSVTIPSLGRFWFTENDINNIYRTIKEG